MYDGVHVDSIHADQSQAARQAAVDNFRWGAACLGCLAHAVALPVPCHAMPCHAMPCRAGLGCTALCAYLCVREALVLHLNQLLLEPVFM